MHIFRKFACLNAAVRHHHDMSLNVLSHTAGLRAYVVLSSCCFKKQACEAGVWAHFFEKSVQLGLKQHSRLSVAARTPLRVSPSGRPCLILHRSFLFCECCSICCVLCCRHYAFAQILKRNGLLARWAACSLLRHSQNALPASKTTPINPGVYKKHPV